MLQSVAKQRSVLNKALHIEFSVQVKYVSSALMLIGNQSGQIQTLSHCWDRIMNQEDNESRPP